MPSKIQLTLKTLLHTKIVLVDTTIKAIKLIEYFDLTYDQNCVYCNSSTGFHAYKLMVNNKKIDPFKTIQQNVLKSGMTVVIHVGLIGSGMGKVCHFGDNIIFYNKNRIDPIILKNYQISLKSDKIPQKINKNTNMIGIVLYRYNNKTDWYLNNIHCKTGYIIVKYVNSLININTIRGSLHSKLYKLIFNADIDHDAIVGAGFAIQNGVLKFNSNIFHNKKGIISFKDDCKDEYADDDIKPMNVYEAIGIHSTLQKWKQNHNKKIWKIAILNHASYFKEFCRSHLLYSFLKVGINDIDEFYQKGHLVKSPYKLI